MRRGSTGLSGVIAVDKPADMTSHDVVNRVRRATGERRVGHAGTLDPAATGLLLVCVGPATRLSPYLTGHDKGYRARIAFGFSTTTDDADGEVLERGEVPPRLLDEDVAAAYLAGIVGEQEQVPPAYSAIKRNGRRSYEVARAGGEVDLQPRTVTVREARLIGIGSEADPWWDVDLLVSKGTYIRSIARDAGRDLSCPAHLDSLRRTRSGNISVDSAHPLDEVEALASAGRADELFCDPVAALDMPHVEIDPELLGPLEQGKKLPFDERCRWVGGHDRERGQGYDAPVAVTCGGRLASIHRIDGDGLVAMAVFPGGVSGCR